MHFNWKDIAERSAWTFVQAAAAVLVAAEALNASVLETAGIAGVAAVLSFVKNLAKQRLERDGVDAA